MNWCAALPILLMLLGTPAVAPADDYYWKTDGSSGSFTGSNWTIGSATTTGGTSWSSSVANNAIFTATSSVSNVSTSIGNLSVTNSSVVTFAGGGSFFAGGVVHTVDAGAGAFLDLGGVTSATDFGTGYIKNGGGVLFMTGGTYKNGFTLNSGTVIAGGTNTFGNGGALIINGGTIAAKSAVSLASGHTFSVGGNFTLGAVTTFAGDDNAATGANITFADNIDFGASTRTINIGANGDYTLGGIISGTGSAGLTVTTSAGAVGRLVLKGVNTYTGQTTVNSGTLTYGASNVINNGSAVTVNGSSAKLDIGSLSDTVGTVTVDGGGTIIGVSGVLSTSSSFELKNGTVSAILGGSAGVNKTTAGTVTLSQANSYAGLTMISDGSLVYGLSNVIGTGPVTVSGPTAMLDLGVNYSDSVGIVTLDGGATIAGTGTASLTSTGTFELKSGLVSVILTGLSKLNKTTTGTVTLSGANTFSGMTTLSDGVLRLATSTSGTNSSITAGPIGKGVLSLSGGAITSTDTTPRTIQNVVSLAGDMTLGDATNSGKLAFPNTATLTGTRQLTVASDVEFSGTVDAGSTTYGLIKAGVGTLTLSGANVYSGGTTISGGTLVASRARVAGGTTGTASSSTGTGKVSVNGGGTLAGAGGVGAVDVNSGGTITAGDGSATTNAAGTLSSGNQKWAGGATFTAKFENSASASGGAGAWDVLSMGTLDLSSLSTGSKFNLTLVKTTTGTFNPANGTNFNLVSATSITYPATYTAATIGRLFVLNTDQLGGSYSDETRFALAFGSSGFSVTVQPAVAPEPATTALVALSGTVAAGRRRRRSGMGLRLVRRRTFGRPSLSV